MRDMVNYTYKEVDPKTLKLGINLDYVWYSWRPYSERSEMARADYDKLEADLVKRGKMINPLIVFRGCVIIGMRRCEIAIKHNWKSVPIWDIQTDISKDRQPDRVYELRDKYKQIKY